MTSAPRRVMPSPRAAVRAQAKAMVDVAHALFGDELEELKLEPQAVLEDWGDVDVQLVAEPDSRDGERCSVAGAYIAVAGMRPVIQIAQAASAGRRAFTALHELGHHLQRTDDDLVIAGWNQPDPFEDLACDAFAAQMLLDDDIVTRLFGDQGPTVENTVQLRRETAASRSAVCVRAAQHLPAPGFAVLLDESGEVFFCATRDLFPLPRGSDQSSVPVVARALRDGRGRGRGERFLYRDGIEGQELFVQAGRFDGDLLLVLAVTDAAPWEGFVLPSRETGPRAATYECSDPGCGATYTSYERRCPSCDAPPCTECGRCCGDGRPTAAATTQKVCPSCYLSQPASAFDGDVCHDCA